MSIQELFSLEGKVAVVIGGGGVLAGEMAQGMASAGADIVIVGRDIVKAEARAEKIRAVGRRAVVALADATNKSHIEGILSTTLESFGRVDILLNAAGVNSGTPFFEITEDEWHRIINVDL